MSRYRRLGLVLGLAALVVHAFALRASAESPALLVADLVPSLPSAASNPRPMAQLGDAAFFLAEDDLHGAELWRTEGTPETTRLLADLCPGTCNSYPSAVAVGDRLVIFARNDEGGALYASDGTAAGTQLIHRFLQPTYLNGVLVAFDDRAWFSAGSGNPYRNELWQSDGTAAGTAAWPVDCGTTCQVESTFLRPAGGALFFGVITPPADPSDDGIRLWRTDGTVAGTRPAEANCPPSCIAHYGPVGVAGGYYYFVGSDTAHGAEVWVAGGGLATPHLVADLAPGNNSPYLVFGFDFRGEAWYQVFIAGTVRWYRFTRTRAVVATEVEPLGPAKAPASVWPAGDRLYFSIQDGATVSLWTVRPGVEGARLLASDLVYADGIGDVDGRALIRIARSGAFQYRLLASDGTVAGTHEIEGIAPLPSFGQRPIAAGSGILINGDDGAHGNEPWVSDGTAAGTRPLGDLRRFAANNSPTTLTAVGDQAAFLLPTNDGGKLYAAGAAAPGAPPTARQPLSDGSFSELAGSGGKLFASQGGYEILAIDLASGTHDSAQVGYGESPFHLTPWRNGVAFGAYEDGEELWLSDGTAAGTRKVRNIYADWPPICPFLCPPAPLYPTEMTPVGERLYFVAVDETGTNLWVSDGSEAGTLPLANTRPYSDVAQLTPFQGGVAFVHYVESLPDISISHGTVASTGPLVPATVESVLLGALGNKLIYTLRQGGFDVIAATDGTPGGTAVLDDLGGAALRPRVRSLRESAPTSRDPLVVRDRLFFAVADDVAGDELWVSDGTATGTRRVADLLPGPQGSYPRSLAAYHGCALFAATDGVTGYEPWASDGQTAWRVADVAPGDAASTPASFTPAGGFVYFTADDGVHGREVFAVATTELDARCAVEPPVNPGPPPGSLTSPAAPGFAFLVKIGPAATSRTGALAPCVAGTVCVTGTAGGSGKVFIRMVATSAGRVAPAIVKLTPEEVEVTVYQLSSGVQKVYRLASTVPPSDVLAGVLGRDAFAASAAASAAFEPMTLLSDAPVRANDTAPARRDAGARWFSPNDIRGYRFKAWLIDATDKRQVVRGEGCLPGTLCFSGPVRGRTDVLVRVLDRRPAAARLTGSGLELWVERTTTHELRKFLLPAEGPTSTSLNGVLDAVGFRR